MAKYYHVRITLPQEKYDEVVLDLDHKTLLERFVEPYLSGHGFVINGKRVDPFRLSQIRLYETARKANTFLQIWMSYRNFGTTQYFSSKEWKIGENVTNDYIRHPPGHASSVDATTSQTLRPSANATDVFVVHGRNYPARSALFVFLRSIGLRPLEWSEAIRATGQPAPYIREILNAAFSKAHAVLVLFTPDDEARLTEPLRSDNDPPHETQLSGQARPNVIFEAGMAFGRFEKRTVLVELGELRPFSDIAGIHVVRLDNTTQRRQELAERLKAAGCPVQLDGVSWHDAGDFEAALLQPKSA